MSEQDLVNRLCGKKLEQLGGREVRDFCYQKVDMLVQLRFQVARTSQISRKHNPEFGMLDAQAVCLESIGNRSPVESLQMSRRERMNLQTTKFKRGLGLPRYKENFERH